MVRVKICGITNIEDAKAAIDCGVDALGFIFYPKSPRYLTIPHAAKIISKLPPFISKVGLFVDEMEAVIRNTFQETGIDTVQFHGDESPDYIKKFKVKSIKALRVKGPETLIVASHYAVDAILLDAYSAQSKGGTGQTFDWTILKPEVLSTLPPLVLAGGLTSENVGKAVETIRPFAVDVSSGVESAPGKKDHVKLREFIRQAKAIF